MPLHILLISVKSFSVRNLKLRILLTLSLAILAVFITPTETLAVPIQSLNGQTGQTQTFQNDSNIIINSLNNIHSINWQGLLSLSRGGTGASSFTAGSLLFSNGTTITQDNSNLFWDDTNNRLGIGTSSPASTLDVSGNAKVTSLTSTADSIINSLNIGLGGGSVVDNTAVGNQALINTNSSSYGNTAVGFETLTSQISGGGNTAVGSYALTGNGSSDSNTAVGASAMKENGAGSFNVAVGADALRLNEIGSFNTALGLQALRNNNSGSSNIAIGYRSAQYQSVGFTALSPNHSIYIGSEARGYDNNDSNSIVIGDAAIGAGANTAVIGNSGLGNVYFGSAAGFANTHAATIYSGSSTVPGCIVMGDISGGVTYVTANAGVLTASATKPSACQ